MKNIQENIICEAVDESIKDFINDKKNKFKKKAKDAALYGTASLTMAGGMLGGMLRDNPNKDKKDPNQEVVNKELRRNKKLDSYEKKNKNVAYDKATLHNIVGEQSNHQQTEDPNDIEMRRFKNNATPVGWGDALKSNSTVNESIRRVLRNEINRLLR